MVLCSFSQIGEKTENVGVGTDWPSISLTDEKTEAQRRKGTALVT